MIARAHVLVAALALVACTPTLSAERGTTYLRAMSEGARHVRAGRFEAGASAYESAARSAERRVDRDEARYRAAKAHERARRNVEALALFDAIAIAHPPSRRTVRARFDAAKLRLELDQRDRALRDLEALCVQTPRDGLASRAFALLVAHAPEASAVAARVLARVEGTELADDVLVWLADHAIAAERDDEARALLERVVREYPYPTGERWDDALWRLADIAERAGDTAKAIAALEQMIAVHETTSNPGSYTLPRFAPAQLRIGRLHRARGEHDRAADAFEAVCDRFSTSRLCDDAMLDHADMLFEANERADGCELLRELVERFEVGHAARQARTRRRTDCAR